MSLSHGFGQLNETRHGASFNTDDAAGLGQLPETALSVSSASRLTERGGCLKTSIAVGRFRGRGLRHRHGHGDKQVYTVKDRARSEISEVDERVGEI